MSIVPDPLTPQKLTIDGNLFTREYTTTASQKKEDAMNFCALYLLLEVNQKMNLSYLYNNFF